MISRIDINDPIFFNRSSLIFYENPKHIKKEISEISEQIIQFQQEIYDILRKKEFEFINLWQFIKLTESQLYDAIQELHKFYPYFTNYPEIELKKLYYPLIFGGVSYSTKNHRIIRIRQFMTWMKDYFEIDDNVDYGFIQIKVDDEFEKNDVVFISYESVKGNLLKSFESIPRITGYHSLSDAELISDLKGRFDFFKSINPDPMALAFATELTMKNIERGSRNDIIENLRIYDKLYILNGRFYLSKLIVKRKENENGFDYILIDYNLPDGIIVKLEQVPESFYILFLLKHPSGLYYEQVKKNRNVLEQIYDRIFKKIVPIPPKQDDIENQQLNTQSESRLKKKYQQIIIEKNEIVLNGYLNNNNISVPISKIKNRFKNTGLHYLIYSHYIIEQEKKQRHKIRIPKEYLYKDEMSELL